MTDAVSGSPWMKTPVLLLLVLAVHAVAIGSFMVMSGCSTPQAPVVEPPPAPVMPPSIHDKQAITPVPRPTIRPPAPVPPPPSTPEAAGGMTYAVQKGDSLSKIAVRHGVSAREIADLNGITDPNKIRIGQKLVLPLHAKGVSSAPAAAPAPAASSAPVAGGAAYTVKPGDTLSKIASAQGTSVTALRSANGLSGDLIRVGQKLVIPGGKPAPQPAVGEPAPAPAPAMAPAPAATMPEPMDIEEPAQADDGITADEGETAGEMTSTPFPYTVKQNDTLDSIARNFGVLKEDILKLNDFPEDAPLVPGDKINIPWQNF